MRGGCLRCSPIAQRDGSTDLLDFFTGGRADFIGFDCQTVLQFTIAKDFDPGEMTTHKVRFPQQLLVHDRSGLECIEVIKIHDRIVSVKSGIVKSALRQPPNQGHLPALEPKSNAAAGARFLSFMAFAAGLSVSGTFTAAEALYSMPRTRARP